MPSLLTCAVCLALGVLVLASPAFSQSIVDSKVCEYNGFTCPRPEDQSYAKYCCVSSDGGARYYLCCNPYLGLYIGVGIGVPIVVVIVGLVLGIYCGCVRYQHRKVQALLTAYNAYREEETACDAPPAYTPLSGDETGVGEGMELPTYTESDPYPSVQGTAGSGEGKEEEEEQESSLTEEQSEEQRSRHDSSQSVELDTIPLINEDN